MKLVVLLIWSGCLLSLTLAAVRFVWIATPAERVLTLALALTVTAGGGKRGLG